VMPDAPEILDRVRGYLDERRLLTTQVHVVAPRYVMVRVRLTLVLKPDAAADRVRQMARASLERFLAPLPDGPAQPGWPFGRAVYVSDVYTVLHAVEGVDYITQTDGRSVLVVETSERLEQAGNELIAVRLRPDELVLYRYQDGDLTCHQV
jgi:predicted phage baseplate assembly protein